MVAPIWTFYSDDEKSNFHAVNELFKFLDIVPPSLSLQQINDLSYEEAHASQGEKWLGKVSGGDVLVFENSVDSDTFVAIDTYIGDTDQVEAICTYVKCRVSVADNAQKLLQDIQSNDINLRPVTRTDVKINDVVNISNYPKPVNDVHTSFDQHISKYRDGRVYISSKPKQGD